MAEEYGSRTRHGRKFGEGTLIGNSTDLKDFFNKEIKQQAIELAWSNGCPIAQELTDPNNPNFGPEKMRTRYAEVNFWYGYIVKRARELNPRLASLLQTPKLRQENQEVGKHEPKSVPGTHLKEISPLSGLYGYALTRILIEQIGQGEERTKEKTLKALDILDEAIINSRNEAEFLAKLASGVAQEDAGPLNVLKHFASKGFLTEENDTQTLIRNLRVLKIIDHALFATYQELTQKDRKALDICDIQI